MRFCTVCGGKLPHSNYYAGRPRLYCSNRCRQAAKWQRRRQDAGHFVSGEQVQR